MVRNGWLCEIASGPGGAWVTVDTPHGLRGIMTFGSKCRQRGSLFLAALALSCATDSAEPEPIALAELRGNNQEGDVSKTLASSVTVRLNRNGAPALGVDVRFVGRQGGPLFTPEMSVTDGTGTASARVYLGPDGGRQAGVVFAGADSIAALSFIATLPLSVRNDGDGSGRIFVRKGTTTVIDCAVVALRACVASFHLGDTLVASGTPDPPYAFMNWSSPSACIDKAVCQFVIVRPMSLWSRFIRVTP
jgi:hypothetical protein